MRGSQIAKLSTVIKPVLKVYSIIMKLKSLRVLYGGRGGGGAWNSPHYQKNSTLLHVRVTLTIKHTVMIENM